MGGAFQRPPEKPSGPKPPEPTVAPPEEVCTVRIAKTDKGYIVLAGRKGEELQQTQPSIPVPLSFACRIAVNALQRLVGGGK
jgi:hypothetical protein